MIKKILKKTFLYKIYRKLKTKHKIKKQQREKRLLEEQKRLEKVLTYEKVEKIINDRYYSKFNENINWDNPQGFSEKMNFTKLYNPSKKKQLLTDKITVRDWIKKKLGEEYLVPIIAIYDSFEEIDFKKLPKEYVIKCNHDSGSIRIIDKDHPLNKEELQEKYHYYLNRNLASCNYEMHYRDIVPKIIIEKKIGDDIKDYKFFCFHGKVKFFKIDFDRFTDHHANYFKPDGTLLPFGERLYPPNFKRKLSMPKTLDEMLKIATKLSKGFDCVRVDLYEHQDKIYFGEMTFTAGNGMSPYSPEEYELEIGSYWKLNTRRRKKLLKKEIIIDRQTPSKLDKKA